MGDTYAMILLCVSYYVKLRKKHLKTGFEYPFMGLYLNGAAYQSADHISALPAASLGSSLLLILYFFFVSHCQAIPLVILELVAFVVLPSSPIASSHAIS